MEVGGHRIRFSRSLIPNLKKLNCNLRSRNGFYASKLIINYISQLIIGLLDKNIFVQKADGGHLAF